MIRKRRGVSSLIGAMIAMGVLLTAFFIILNQAQANVRTATTMFQNVERLAMEREAENIVVEVKTADNEVIQLTNNGSSDTLVKWLVIKNPQVTLVDLYLAAQNKSRILTLISAENATPVAVERDGYLLMRVGGKISFKTSTSSVEPLAVITSTGNVIKVIKTAYSSGTEFAAVAGSVVVYPVTLGADLVNRTDLTVDEDELTIPTEQFLGVGMKTHNNHYVAVAIYNDTTVEADWLHFGNLVIGYNPTWVKNRNGPPKYNILLTGPYDIGNRWTAVLTVGGDTYSLDYNLYRGWRVKIIGFVPDTSDDLFLHYENSWYNIYEERTGSDALGIWYYGTPNTGSEGWVRLKGHADKIIIYARRPGEVEFSYDPYFIPADTDGNGNPEYIFMTEDVNWGNVRSFDDARASSCLSTYKVYEDWSVKPFFINLTGYKIDSTNIALVTVAFRIYYHDNAGDDTREVYSAGRWLIGVYLVDAQTGEIAEKREYNYQELMVMEDTYPPNTGYFVQTVTLLLPETGHDYYIAFGFMDPYSNYCHDPEADPGANDPDVTIGIEWLGMSFYARPPG